MQRLFQRVKNAERHAKRHTKKVKDRQELGEKWRRRQAALRLQRTTSNHIRDARRNRREDYAAGALAPRRDVGELADTYASMAIFDINLPEKDPEERVEWSHVRKGDRVVVTRGRDRGRIGEVTEVDEKRNQVKVTDINVTSYHIPAWFPRDEGDDRKVVDVPAPIPLKDVKLVFPLPHPTTGKPRDVVIDRLVKIETKTEKQKRQKPDGFRDEEENERVIAGTDIIIPWPDKLEPEYEVHEGDTDEMLVEEETFRPVLLHAPMPLTVIDELRGKHSKFRKRYDWEFVQKKEQEDAEVERKKIELPKTMRTPLEELAELRARQKAASERELSQEQLAKIGEVIAAEKAKMQSAVKRPSL